MTAPARFPFGQPVLERRPEITEARRTFVIGAYPSALHVYWRPLPKGKPIRAMAVDNEPEIFWNGRFEASAIDQWKKSVGYQPEWGEIAAVGALNGSSGRWVEQKVLTPLGCSRQEAWLTDCLDTYRCSNNLSDRLDDTYEPYAKSHGLPGSNLWPHPDEDGIVAEALFRHKERLLSELTAAHPEMVVTLGNAALRVFKAIVPDVPVETPDRLSSDSILYGQKFTVNLSPGYSIRWLPLAHPAAPQPYQLAHATWLGSL